ncbi:MAG: hypothetical protein ACOY0R_11840, partial [Chloroflexota bacterium]
MKTFHILRSIKIRQLVIFLILAGTTGWMGSFAFHGLPTYSALIDAFLVSNLFFGILTLWIALVLYASQRAKLTFDQEFMRFSSVSPRLNGLLPFWLHPFTIRYGYIKWVERGALPGSLFITGTNGKTMRFLTSLFGKNYGEEILVELKSHLPAECLDKNIELRFKWTKAEVVHQIVQLSISLVLLITMVFDPTIPYIGGWYLKDWHVEARFSWLENADVNSVPSVDEYWVVTENFVPKRILHGSHGRVQEWDVPELSADDQISFISGDANQNPILWLDDRILHFDGQWETIRYQGNTIFELLKYQGRVQGETALVMPGYPLVRINALTGRWEAVALPQTAVEQQLLPDQIQVTPQGDFLVLMSSEQASRIFILAKDGWKPQEYPIDLPQDGYAVDVTLGTNEAVWVLYRSRTDRQNYSVMKTDMTGQTSITRLPPVPTRDDDYPRYQNLYVDVHDRIWVYGNYPEFMAIFSPVWQGDALVVEQYTKSNSNFPHSPAEAPIMSPDGLIWAFDETIVKMDTNLADLPAPLPFSLTSVEWGVIRLVIMGVQLPYL